MTNDVRSRSRAIELPRRLLAHAVVRYLFALAMVASAFGLRLLVAPWTGKGAPFVLFFGATLVTSLVAGTGPGLLALASSLPLAAITFAMPAGATPSEAAFQSMLYALDGLIIIELTHLIRVARRRLQHANRDLGEGAARLAASEARTRDVVNLSPDAYFQANLEGRFADVNEAACKLLGYGRADLLGKTILDIIPPEDAERLSGVRAALLTPGATHVGEWTLLHRDGTAVPVEVSANILPDGRWQAFIRDITARKQVEDAVRQSEQKFRQLVERMPDGVFIYQAGRIVYANRSFGGLLGYDDARLLHERAASEFVSSASLDVVRARIQLIEKAGQAAPPQELTMVRRDGSPVIVETVGIGMEFEGALAILVVVRDLTERVRAQEALRFSEAKFSGIVSISSDAIISIDEEQRITVFNAGAEQIFGYSREEVLGAPLDRLIPEAFVASHRRHVADFAGGQVTARRMGERFASIKGRRKNGADFPAEASISHLKVGDKKFLTVVLRDVTERDRLDREQRILAEVGVVLAASLDYEETLATIARIAVQDFADWCIVEIMETPDGPRRLKVASADPTKAAIADQLDRIRIDRGRPYLTRSVVELRQPLLISRVTPQQIDAAAQSREHLQLLHAVAPASLLTVPLLHRDQLLGTLSFVSSQPARTYASSDLRLANALGERAALAIENARLYRAALHATKLRDQVLGVVAHDLRNPLGTIALHAGALQRPAPAPERRSQKHKEAIERATRRMNRLIQDLLDVAVLEAGRLKVDRAPIATAELVADAVEMQRALAASSSIDLREAVAGDAPPVLGDRDRLLQVFENLIGNALKFTDAGGRITVGAARGDAGTLFWVADTGRGLTGDDLGRVFEPFWQASARSGRLGAGLGLPITKGIVEAHAGRIWVESAPGQGSTFFFSIPAAPPDADRAASVH